MSCKNVSIPAEAEAAGMTKLVFCEDFESDTAIDFSGEGKKGYSFYADRPYGMPTLTPKECVIKDSVLYLTPEVCGAAIGPCTYSKQGDCGFTMQFGYVEARIRADLPTGEYDGWPAFWMLGLNDIMGRSWDRLNELDILEMVDPLGKGKSGGVRQDVIFTGTLHDHLWEDINGERVKKLCTSSVVATGYKDQFDYIDNEWHTYAALWMPGYIAWYMDNKLMHAARFEEGKLPEYYYRDSETPTKRLGEIFPHITEETWEGAHTIADHDTMAIFLGANKNWPMEVDWVRVWQK